MLSASDKFIANLRGPHSPRVRIGLYVPDETGEYQFQTYYGISEGSLTIDNSRNIRRQATLTVASLDTSYDSEYVGSMSTREFLATLTSKSSEITIEFGLVFSDLSTEWVTLARLRVEEFGKNVRGGSVQVSAAYDAGSRVEDFSLVTPYAPYDILGAKLTYVNAIKDLVNTAYPSTNQPTWQTFAGVDTVSSPPDNTSFTGSRWTAINELAKAINVVVAPDETGVWQIKPAALDRTIRWKVNAGEDGVLVGEDTSFSRREQYNAVALRWESPKSATGSETGFIYLVDSDPESPTYYDGPFGRKPRPEETVSTITSSDQAVAAAQTILDQSKGLTRSVTLTSVHNPLLEPGDCVSLHLPDGSIERHVIDSLTIPLRGGTMTMQTRLVADIGIDYNSNVNYETSTYNYEGTE